MRVSATDLDAVIRAALQPEQLVVQDDSHQHAGHAGAREGSHFSVRVVSAAFVGKSRVARHRLVYDAAAAFMNKGIHALAIDARAPSEI